MGWHTAAMRRGGISLFIKGEENEFVFPHQSVWNETAHSHSTLGAETAWMLKALVGNREEIVRDKVDEWSLNYGQSLIQEYKVYQDALDNMN